MMDAERPPMPPTDPPPADPLEKRLRAQALLSPPPDLAARVMLGLPPRHRGFDRRALVRFAAAVVTAFGVWFFATGAVPSAATAAPAPLVERTVADARAALPEALDRGLVPWTASVPEAPRVHPAWIALLGAILLVGGLWLARRALRRPPQERNVS